MSLIEQNDLINQVLESINDEDLLKTASAPIDYSPW
jgi:hypothetical protein